jgi:hypothetical protein
MSFGRILYSVLGSAVLLLCEIHYFYSNTLCFLSRQTPLRNILAPCHLQEDLKCSLLLLVCLLLWMAFERDGLALVLL